MILQSKRRSKAIDDRRTARSNEPSDKSSIHAAIDGSTNRSLDRPIRRLIGHDSTLRRLIGPSIRGACARDHDASARPRKEETGRINHTWSAAAAAAGGVISTAASCADDGQRQTRGPLAQDKTRNEQSLNASSIQLIDQSIDS